MTKTFDRSDPSHDLNDRKEVRRYLEACTEQDPGGGILLRAAPSDIARTYYTPT